MRKRVVFAGLLVAALCPTVAANARDQLGERDVVTIDPGRAYIFFRTPERMNLRLLREVDPAERAAWEADRERAFQRARDRNRRRITEWDRQAPECSDRALAFTPQCEALGPRPQVLTSESFDFAPPEADNFVDITRGREFERTEAGFTYLRAVEPGTYILYGPITATPQAVVGICLCMGSVRFEARPGQIVDVGELRLEPREGDGPGEGRFDGNGRLPSPMVVPSAAGTALPQRLAGLPVVAAELRAADQMPNYFGILIDRLAPLPGVLGYERGRVIDLREQAGASTSPGME